MERHFIGIDVGTGSARAGLFTATGDLRASASRPIRIWRPRPNHSEQSSEDIWSAVCQCVRETLEISGVAPESVGGIGFDATCSLVVLDGDGRPLAVNEEGQAERNIILWMDHRAAAQAERINETGAKVLDYVGGRISPEMETPKLLWLSETLPDTFSRAGYFLDLTDFLTWRASGSLWRSTCTVTCKWTYMAHENRWDEDYFRSIGLGALADEGFARIGTEMRQPGTALPGGLTEAAADELGLAPGTAVATGLIDAHAGALGTMGAEGLPGALENRLAYVFGTSACTLNMTATPTFVPGVWGPYYDALLPDCWLNEGGQSAAGAAIDHLVRLHPHAPAAQAQAEAAGQGLAQWLDARASELLQRHALPDVLHGLHVVPEFLGNRAPFADPEARAVIAGLGLEEDEDSLVRLYLAGLASIGYGLRQIIAALKGQGLHVSTVVVSGGAGNSALVRRILAGAADVTVATVETPEPVLLGSAMLGAVAAGDKASVTESMHAMSRVGHVTAPTEERCHAARYKAFLLLQDCHRKLRGLEQAHD